MKRAFPGRSFQEKAAARAWARAREIGAEASRAAQARLLEQEWFWMATPLGCYRSGPGEVGTERLWEAGAERGWEMAAPGRGTAGRYAWRWGGTEWRRGAHGLEEATGPVVPGAALRTVVVPGVAFDARGVRLGHGGGDFDRLLAECPEAWRVGLCAESRLAAELPREPHDAVVDAVVTEARVLYAPGAEAKLARWLAGGVP